MSLLISLRSESVKHKRTSSVYLCVFMAALVPILMFFEFLESAPDGEKTKLWNFYFIQLRQLLNFVFLPMFIILVSTLLMQIEYRNNTWKQVLSSPQNLLSVIISKFFVLQIAIILFLLSYNIWVAVFGFILDSMEPQMFENGINYKSLLINNVNTYISVLAISAFQFWLALRFKNFIAPLAIGFCLWFLGPLMIFELKWELAQNYPYAFPALVILPDYKAKIPNYLWLSVGFAILFITLSFLEFRSKKIKS